MTDDKFSAMAASRATHPVYADLQAQAEERFGSEPEIFSENMPDNVFRLSENMSHRLDRKMSDALARTAIQNGWAVRRWTSTYFRATKKVGGATVQINPSVLHGKLKASRVEVLDESDDAYEVEAWLEAER